VWDLRVQKQQKLPYKGGGVTADLLISALRAQQRGDDNPTAHVPTLASAVAAVTAANRMAAALPTLKKKMGAAGGLKSSGRVPPTGAALLMDRRDPLERVVQSATKLRARSGRTADAPPPGSSSMDAKRLLRDTLDTPTPDSSPQQ
jgi:hypothetical protein